MGSPIERFKKLFPSWNIEPGYLVSLSEESFPLKPDLLAGTLNDFLSGLSL
jgi:hypothetical protein